MIFETELGKIRIDFLRQVNYKWVKIPESFQFNFFPSRQSHSHAQDYRGTRLDCINLIHCKLSSWESGPLASHQFRFRWFKNQIRKIVSYRDGVLFNPLKWNQSTEPWITNIIKNNWGKTRTSRGSSESNCSNLKSIIFFAFFENHKKRKILIKSDILILYLR